MRDHRGLETFIMNHHHTEYFTFAGAGAGGLGFFDNLSNNAAAGFSCSIISELSNAGVS
jgi:hypothetical protein